MLPVDKDPKPAFSSPLNITYIKKEREWHILTQKEQTPRSLTIKPQPHWTKVGFLFQLRYHCPSLTHTAAISLGVVVKNKVRLCCFLQCYYLTHKYILWLPVQFCCKVLSKGRCYMKSVHDMKYIVATDTALQGLISRSKQGYHN